VNGTHSSHNILIIISSSGCEQAPVSANALTILSSPWHITSCLCYCGLVCEQAPVSANALTILSSPWHITSCLCYSGLVCEQAHLSAYRPGGTCARSKAEGEATLFLHSELFDGVSLIASVDQSSQFKLLGMLSVQRLVTVTSTSCLHSTPHPAVTPCLQSDRKGLRQASSNSALMLPYKIKRRSM
jgi:hypothetical protein